MQRLVLTQQNAALVEEMAAEAESLCSQAADLVQVVAVFELGKAGHSGRGVGHRPAAVVLKLGRAGRPSAGRACGRLRQKKAPLPLRQGALSAVWGGLK